MFDALLDMKAGIFRRSYSIKKIFEERSLLIFFQIDRQSIDDADMFES